MDYSLFLLEVRKNLKLYEEAVLKRKFKEAHKHAVNAGIEIRLMTHLTKEMI
jgi:hypothetical protein